uniref:Sprouty n=1 Tax=Timema bartmani TaxID=61472 RepID=A0A7R9I4U3_9NEOP|nr:unnamed protein product [Timema bartmani]
MKAATDRADEADDAGPCECVVRERDRDYMAQHGGLAPPRTTLRPAVTRVHRPRLAIVTAPPPTTITLQPLATARRRQLHPPIEAIVATSAGNGGGDSVTLATPRPDGERTVNEYVETPFRPAAGVEAVSTPFSSSVSVIKSTSSARTSVGRVRDPHFEEVHLPMNKGPPWPGRGAVVSKQPGASATFKKECASGGAGGSGECYRGSIICPECSRCRCESCRQPRPLPSKWLCNNKCLFSAETSVDYASCLCFVKGLSYHCAGDPDGDGDTCVDDPCSCGPPDCLARWGYLGLLSVLLPCLWCYWPLRGCAHLCERCYARYSGQGCRCQPPASDLTPEKRLLASSPDF